MSVEDVLVTRLLAHAGTAALIVDRVHPNFISQNSPMPAVSYARISALRTLAMGVNPGLVSARFQFDAWAKDYTGVRDLAEQLRLALERFNSLGPPVIQDIFFENEVDLYEDQTKTHHVALDFRVIYQE